MTATYNIAVLTTSARTRIRLIIGDNETGGSGTVVRNPFLQDEEIDIEVTKAGALAAASGADDLAALDCCRHIMAARMRDVDTNAAGVSTSRSQRFNQIADVVRMLEDRIRAQCTIVPVHRLQTTLDNIDADIDRLKPPFRVGQDDHP